MVVVGVIAASAFSTRIKAFTDFGISPLLAAAPVKTPRVCLSDDLPIAALRCRCCGIERPGATGRNQPWPAGRVAGPSRRSLSARR